MILFNHEACLVQVYWRDTRRAVGVNGFKLLHSQLRDNNASLPTGTRFADSVAIGDYNDDTHHLATSVCSYPAYLNGRGEGEQCWQVWSNCFCALTVVFHVRSQTLLHSTTSPHGRPRAKSTCCWQADERKFSRQQQHAPASK
jgi:hypothetical protein